MDPGRFCVGMSIVVLALSCVFLVTQFDYLGEFWIVLWADHALRLVLMGAAWAGCIVAGTYQLARVLVLGEVGQRVGLLERAMRRGQGGDPELRRALDREETGRYAS